jgi:hypothetical protein
MDEIVIAGRFNGPPASGHGGYTCGLVARLLGGRATEVRLRRPPPLDRPLRWDGERLLDGDEVVASGRLLPEGERPVEIPPPVSVDQARKASNHFPGLVEHPFPTCFGCGPRRAEGDGLRVFAGPVEGRRLAAAPWVPHRSLLVGGEIPAEVVFATLDCTGGWGGMGQVQGTFVLGTMAAAVEQLVTVDQAYVVMGWHVGTDGRKLHCASSVHTGPGDLVGWSAQTWIRVT